MTRIVVRVQSIPNGPELFYLEESPFAVKDPDEPAYFTCDATPVFSDFDAGKLQPTVVKDVGRKLYESLGRHAGVKQALASALASPTSICPIYIQVQTRSDGGGGGGIDALPWETLCPDDRDDFFALSDAWPVARILSDGGPIDAVAQPFKPPVRMAAFVSAEAYSGAEELAALRRAVEQAEVPVQLKVFVGEAALLSDPPGTRKTLGAGSVEIALVPADRADALDAIAKFKPQLLHFFCHGSAENGPHLRLATHNDWLAKAGSSLRLDTTDIAGIPGISQFVWLVTLNCCLGAAPVKNAHSLARSLVAKGIPAVVGMRDVIDVEYANRFADMFYARVFEDLRPGAITREASVEVCWPKLVTPARRALRDWRNTGVSAGAAALAAKEWTLPVLYVRRSPFRLRAVASDVSDEESSALIARLRTLLAVRDGLQSLGDVPAAALAEIDDQIVRTAGSLYG